MSHPAIGQEDFHKFRELFSFCDVQDQWIVLRPSLCKEDLGYGCLIQPVGSQPVHGFRRKRDELAFR